MAYIYTTMVEALRDHWAAHNNAYPQRFELTADAFKLLKESRETVLKNLNFTLRSGWENEFQGTPVAVASGGNCMVDAAGNRVPLAL